MAPTYGLAEQAAAIIRSLYNGTPSPADLQTQTANPATRTNTATTATSTPTNKSAAGSAASTTASSAAGATFQPLGMSFFITIAVSVFGAIVGSVLV